MVCPGQATSAGLHSVLALQGECQARGVGIEFDWSVSAPALPGELCTCWVLRAPSWRVAHPRGPACCVQETVGPGGTDSCVGGVCLPLESVEPPVALAESCRWPTAGALWEELLRCGVAQAWHTLNMKARRPGSRTAQRASAPPADPRPFCREVDSVGGSARTGSPSACRPLFVHLTLS